MKTENYIKPQIEAIEVSPEGVMAFSSGGNSIDLNETEDGYNGNSYVKRRSFWDE